MALSSNEELANTVRNPEAERLERLTCAFELRLSHTEESLALLIELAKMSELPDELSDEVGRSLANVARRLSKVDGVYDPDSYQFTPAAFDAFDQEANILKTVDSRGR